MNIVNTVVSSMYLTGIGTVHSHLSSLLHCLECFNRHYSKVHFQPIYFFKSFSITEFVCLCYCNLFVSNCLTNWTVSEASNNVVFVVFAITNLTALIVQYLFLSCLHACLWCGKCRNVVVGTLFDSVPCLVSTACSAASK